MQVLADANCFNEENLKALQEKRIDAYIPDPMFRKRDPRSANADEHKGKTRTNVYDKKSRRACVALRKKTSSITRLVIFIFANPTTD